MDKRLSDIYHGVIMDHNNHPVHFEKPGDYDHDLDAYNPLCGDHFHIYLEVKGERIQRASFYGYGCAISKAATSILVKSIQNRPLIELPVLIDHFRQALTGSQPSTAEFEAFRPVAQFPSRIKCATLSWDELEKFLAGPTRVEVGRYPL